MKDSFLMLLNFLENPKEIGAVVPSSKYLTKEIIKNIDFKNSKNIVELGPGLGTFTKVILKKADPTSKVICFEVNRKFCSYIAKNFADTKLILVNAGAEDIGKNLRNLNIKNADCIVSGLPFRNFSNIKKKKILMEVKNTLNPQGKFILFQYTNSLGKILQSYFSKVNRLFVPINMPPAFVYVCEN